MLSRLPLLSTDIPYVVSNKRRASERASGTNTGVVPFVYYIMLLKYSNERHRRLAFDTGTASIVDPSHSCLPALFVLVHFPWEPGAWSTSIMVFVVQHGLYPFHMVRP